MYPCASNVSVKFACISIALPCSVTYPRGNAIGLYQFMLRDLGNSEIQLPEITIAVITHAR